MSSGGNTGNTGGVAGSDESFIAFAFSIVTLVMMCLYFPVLFGCMREAFQFVTGSKPPPRRRRPDDDSDDESNSKPNWRILVDDFTELPRVILKAVRFPNHVATGARLMWSNTALARQVFLDDAVRFCFRPRFIFLVLWVFLLTSAMYASITFDPHAILGVERTASTKDIKQAYRRLSKINHPDHNKTDAAKAIYPRIRRAYKALVDVEAFEKDIQHEETSAGIGLPIWLTNRENDTLVLFGLLGVLIGVPAFIWYKFKGDIMQKLRERLASMRRSEELLEPLFLQLGIPIDPKYVERRRERQELAGVLCSIGVMQTPDERMVDHMPPLTDLQRAARDPRRNEQGMYRFGIPPQLFESAHEFFKSYELQPSVKLPEADFVRTDRVSYETLRYVVEKTQQRVLQDAREVQRCVEVMTGMRGIELSHVKKLEKIHREFMETLIDSYKESQKVLPRDLRVLMESLQRRNEVLNDIPREIDQIFQTIRDEAQRQMMKQGGGGGAHSHGPGQPAHSHGGPAPRRR